MSLKWEAVKENVRQKEWKKEKMKPSKFWFFLNETCSWQTRRLVWSSETPRKTETERKRDAESLSLCSLWSFSFLGRNERRTREVKINGKKGDITQNANLQSDSLISSLVHSDTALTHRQLSVCVCLSIFSSYPGLMISSSTGCWWLEEPLPDTDDPSHTCTRTHTHLKAWWCKWMGIIAESIKSNQTSSGGKCVCVC